MIATNNMAEYYKNARVQLLSQKPKAIQREINNNPSGRSANELTKDVIKLAESWEYDGMDAEGNDWDNHIPF